MEARTICSRSWIRAQRGNLFAQFGILFGSEVGFLMSRARLYQTAVKVIPYPDLFRMTPILLSPIALIAGLMASWRFGVDAGWTDSFVVSDGFLSHWQVWLAMAIAIQWSAVHLDRLLKKG